MSDWTKTGLFALAAVVTAGLAFAVQGVSRTGPVAGFERVGEEFFPEFSDPLAARSLRLVTYDPDTTIIRPFDVTFDGGTWRISPHGYPVDAAERLAKTAGSVIGVRREGLASRRETDYARYGVIDPLIDDPTALTGRGTRLTLKDTKGGTLADYIVGKPVEGQEGVRYVRLPGEKETYRARIAFDLSTDFADWIKSGLLGVAASELRRIEIRDYSIDQDRMTAAERDSSPLTRPDAAAPWELAGLEAATSQVKQAVANKVAQTLANLKIIGVRPQPAGLNPDLTVDATVGRNPLAMRQLSANLVSKGFLPLPGDNGEPRLYGKEGEISTVTTDGVAYDLFFGETVTGSGFDLEFGDAAGEAEQTLRDAKGESKAKPKQGRYLFAVARFVPDALGSPPEPPADAAPPAGGESGNEQATAARAEYQRERAAYDARIAEAKRKVEQLNERFKGWYYVISDENFADLRLSRSALIEPKPAALEQPSPAAPLSDDGAASNSGAASPAMPAAPDADAAPDRPSPIEAPRPGR